MEPVLLTYESLRQDPRVLSYIDQADAYVEQIGYIRHGLCHVTAVAERASALLLLLGYPERYAELVKMAGILHDIGNTVNRIEHAQSGACMAFSLLQQTTLRPEEIGMICTAIGNHDEHTGVPVSAAAAAIILADKTDVRHSRARHPEICPSKEDIHNRVNYAVTDTAFVPDPASGTLTWTIDLDPACASSTDFLTIYRDRMAFCVQAADRLELRFILVLNGQTYTEFV